MGFSLFYLELHVSTRLHHFFSHEAQKETDEVGGQAEDRWQKTSGGETGKSTKTEAERCEFGQCRFNFDFSLIILKNLTH